MDVFVVIGSNCSSGHNPSPLVNYSTDTCEACSSAMTTTNCQADPEQCAPTESPEPSSDSSGQFEEARPQECDGSKFKVSVVAFNSERLQPIRHKWKNVIFSILETGIVCLELLKGKDGPTKTMEVFQISSDGCLVRFKSYEILLNTITYT